MLTDWLKQLMENSKLSDYRIARLSGVNASVISRFHKGHSITLETADKLAKAIVDNWRP